MSIKRIEIGPRMSQAVTGGGLVFLAGQTALGDGVAAQTKGILDQIDRLLAAAGTDKSRLLSATIWLTDMADFAAMNAVWEAWVDPKNPPGRATAAVAALATPDYIIEIIVVALAG